MQAFRRLYSSIPDAAAAARTASTPRAVRLRRLRKRPEVPAGASDATPSGLTPSEQTRFQRSYAKGELTDGAGNYLSEGQWLNRLDARRQRIRGIRVAKSEAGEKELQVVGQKVYLPNVIFTLVRNHTPPGQPYNPYEATFRVAQSITKTDIRSYLSAAYGVKSTYIRTDNYSAKTSVLGQTKSVAYKRAVVGLVDPFYFPKAVEDMNAKDRKEREDWLEENFRMQQDKDDRKSVQLLISRRRSDGWRWRTGVTANRRNIIHLIAARRAERESLLADMKVQVRAARQSAVSQPA